MVPTEEIEACVATGQIDDPGLVRVQLQPERGKDLGHQESGCFGPVGGSAQDDGVVGVADQHSQSMATSRPFLISRTFNAMLAINGEIGDPAGFPTRIESSLRPREPPLEAMPRAACTSPDPGYPTTHLGHERVVIDRPEAVTHMMCRLKRQRPCSMQRRVRLADHSLN